MQQKKLPKAMVEIIFEKNYHYGHDDNTVSTRIEHNLVFTLFYFFIFVFFQLVALRVARKKRKPICIQMVMEHG